MHFGNGAGANQKLTDKMASAFDEMNTTLADRLRRLESELSSRLSKMATQRDHSGLFG
jgi:hypothetical protein